MAYGNFKEENLNILLVGSTGSGKSSTGNTILSVPKGILEHFFYIGTGSDPKTKDNQIWKRLILGRNVTVVDTPGADNTRDDPYEVQKEIRDAISNFGEGFDAIVLVLRVFKTSLKMSEEELNTIDVIQTILGENFWKHGIFLFTHGDNFDRMLNDEKIENPNAHKPTFEDFVRMHHLTQNKYAIGKYTDKVDFATVLFENEEPDAKERESMVEQLLHKVYKLKERNRDSRFTNHSLPPPKYKIPSFYWLKKSADKAYCYSSTMLDRDINIKYGYVLICLLVLIISALFAHWYL